MDYFSALEKALYLTRQYPYLILGGKLARMFLRQDEIGEVDSLIFICSEKDFNINLFQYEEAEAEKNSVSFYISKDIKVTVFFYDSAKYGVKDGIKIDRGFYDNWIKKQSAEDLL